MFICLECGKKFSTDKAARRAVERGCPRCHGTDIDLDPRTGSVIAALKREGREMDGMARRASAMGSDFLDHDHSMDH